MHLKNESPNQFPYIDQKCNFKQINVIESSENNDEQKQSNCNEIHFSHYTRNMNTTKHVDDKTVNNPHLNYCKKKNTHIEKPNGKSQHDSTWQVKLTRNTATIYRQQHETTAPFTMTAQKYIVYEM